MSPSCREWTPLLSAHLDGELSGEREAGLREHLDACAACRRELESIRRVAEMMAARTEPDPYFLTRFRARRAEEALRVPWRMLALRLVPLCLAALLGGGLAIWSSLGGNGLGELERL